MYTKAALQLGKVATMCPVAEWKEKFKTWAQVRKDSSHATNHNNLKNLTASIWGTAPEGDASMGSWLHAGLAWDGLEKLWNAYHSTLPDNIHIPVGYYFGNSEAKLLAIDEFPPLAKAGELQEQKGHVHETLKRFLRQFLDNYDHSHVYLVAMPILEHTVDSEPRVIEFEILLRLFNGDQQAGKALPLLLPDKQLRWEFCMKNVAFAFFYADLTGLAFSWNI